MGTLTLPFSGTYQSTNTTAFSVTTTGGIGIVGTSTGQDGVHGESGSPQHAGVLGLNTSSAGYGVYGGATDVGSGVKGESVNGPGVYGNSTRGSGVYGTSTGGDAVYGLSHSTLAAGVRGINDSGGPGVYGAAASADGVHGDSQSSVHAGVSGVNGSGGNGVYGSASGSDGVYGQSQSNAHAGVSGLNNAGGPGVYGTASSWDGVHGDSQSSAHAGVSGVNTSGGIGVYGQGGPGPAGQFNGDVKIFGTLTATVDIVLGSDCAEDFDIATSEEVEPGTVMALTDEGALQPCQDSYDRKVAGVISGAGDYKPGLILGRTESPLKRLPLALMGKVFCKVDADYSPIVIGDLLTTSPTRGHAMKARDSSKAFGSVIGKALRSHKEGTGLIPILIALQ
jgi:hypothetical protein